jgi:hypothetical protein
VFKKDWSAVMTIDKLFTHLLCDLFDSNISLHPKKWNKPYKPVDIFEKINDDNKKENEHANIFANLKPLECIVHPGTIQVNQLNVDLPKIELPKDLFKDDILLNDWELIK